MPSIRIPLALTLALAACGADDEGGPQGDTTVLVSHYDYRFDLETRAATVAITGAVESPGHCVSLPMRAQAPTNVLMDGEPIASGEFAEGVLRACGRGWDAGTEIVIEASMTVPMQTWNDSQVGLSSSPDAEGQLFHYMVSWVGGCDRFGPCDSAPDRFATYRFTVAHPSGTQVLCPGQITSGDTETVCQLDHDAPTYSAFGLAASPSWVEVDLGDWAGIATTLYDMPSIDMASSIDSELHSGFVAWMEGTFGPYPYGDELRLFVGPTYWSGFEHPGNIALSDALNGGSPPNVRTPTHTINHELVHQWAGDQTTLAGVYDFVWKEAMAEYLTFVYEDEQVAESTGRATALGWKRSAGFAQYYPVPAEEPALIDFYGDVYGPGPMILFRQIEAMYGREAVLSALAGLLGQTRALSVAEVEDALTAATGADLSNYFDTWLYGEGTPVMPSFSLMYTQAGDGALSYRLAQVEPEELMGCAFAIHLTGDATGDIAEIWIDLGPDGSAEVMGEAEPGFAVTGWTIDPHGHCLVKKHSATSARIEQPYRPWLAPPRIR